MNKKQKIILIGVALGATLFSSSCKKEDDTPVPTISDYEVGVNNSGEVNQGEYLPIKANITAEGGISVITVEIIPTTTEWLYYEEYTEYAGLTSLTFHDSILIPETAEVGQYTFKLNVQDYNENVTPQASGLYIGEAPILFNSITGLVVDDAGNKYIGTENGMFTLDEENGTYQKVNNGIQLSPVNALALTPKVLAEEIWLGSNDGALNYTSQTQYQTSNSGLHNNTITHFSFDINNRLFFGTPNGISIKDANDWLMSIGKDSLYLKYTINSMGTATNGYTYVATEGGGVERFKYDVDGISGATIFDEDWTKLETNFVSTVFVDDTVQAYGTPEGIAMHYSHLTKWDWENYSEDDGLINNNVISIVKDANDNWWFGTTKGLSMMNDEQWTSFDSNTEGFLGDNIKFLAAGNDGSVWFANNNGLCRYLNNEWTSFPK